MRYSKELLKGGYMPKQTVHVEVGDGKFVFTAT